MTKSASVNAAAMDDGDGDGDDDARGGCAHAREWRGGDARGGGGAASVSVSASASASVWVDAMGVQDDDDDGWGDDEDGDGDVDDDDDGWGDDEDGDGDVGAARDADARDDDGWDDDAEGERRRSSASAGTLPEDDDDDFDDDDGWNDFDDEELLRPVAAFARERELGAAVEMDEGCAEAPEEEYEAFEPRNPNRFNPYAKENLAPNDSIPSKTREALQRTGGDDDDDDEEEEFEFEDEPPSARPSSAPSASRMAMLPSRTIADTAPWRARLPHFVPVTELAPQTFHDGEIIHVDYVAQFGGARSAVAKSRPASASEFGSTLRATNKSTAAKVTPRWYTDERGRKIFIREDGSKLQGAAAYKAFQKLSA